MRQDNKLIFDYLGPMRHIIGIRSMLLDIARNCLPEVEVRVLLSSLELVQLYLIELSQFLELGIHVRTCLVTVMRCGDMPRV